MTSSTPSDILAQDIIKLAQRKYSPFSHRQHQTVTLLASLASKEERKVMYDVLSRGVTPPARRDWDDLTSLVEYCQDLDTAIDAYSANITVDELRGMVRRGAYSRDALRVSAQLSSGRKAKHEQPGSSLRKDLAKKLR